MVTAVDHPGDVLVGLAEAREPAVGSLGTQFPEGGVGLASPSAPRGVVRGRGGSKAIDGVIADVPDFHVTIHGVVSNDDSVWTPRPSR
ncbi:hypothetical protein BRC68_09255 [Halobacteriales archaeon QH_6_64_20]|nr:MAG: hypothetical protein BRC68_09255 [Halobacteriales archaeon QH_6_64_20]